MIRALAAAGLIALATLLLFLLKPSNPAPRADVSPRKGRVEARVEEPPAPSRATPRRAPPPRLIDAALSPDAAPEVKATPAPVAPLEPLRVTLGPHTTPLKGGEGKARVTIHVEATDAPTKRELRLKRQWIQRALFFLMSHRAAAGLEGEAGRARLEADLQERFERAIKSGEIKVRVDPITLERAPTP